MCVWQHIPKFYLVLFLFVFKHVQDHDIYIYIFILNNKALKILFPTKKSHLYFNWNYFFFCIVFRIFESTNTRTNTKQKIILRSNRDDFRLVCIQVGRVFFSLNYAAWILAFIIFILRGEGLDIKKLILGIRFCSGLAVQRD